MKINFPKRKPRPEKPATQPGLWRQKVAASGKLVVAVLLVIIFLPTMGMLWIKDGRQNPAYCAGCHQDPYYVDYAATDSILLAHQHALRSVSCQTCHDRSLGDSLSELQAYIVGYEVPLKEGRMSMEVCLACHGSYAQIMPLTAVEVTGAERNPHAGHWGELECTVCHKLHRDSIDYCSGCHNPVTEAPGWVRPPSQ